jgi:CRP/FNR family transcriptional regulator
MVCARDLCACDLFTGLNEENLEEIASIAREETYQAGDLICAERQRAERIFVLCEGRVQLRVRLRSLAEPDAELTIEEVRPGSVFGWSSLVKQRQFTASARALEPVRLLAIGSEDLDRLFDRNAHIGFVVMKQLAEVIASRLCRTREQCGQQCVE